MRSALSPMRDTASPSSSPVQDIPLIQAGQQRTKSRLGCQKNVLKFDFKEIFHHPMTIIGNFPYNIGSQILFKVLENRDLVLDVICIPI